MKIAICDDDPIFSRHIADLISANDLYVTDEVRLYAAGLDLVQDYRANVSADLIFLDLEMPGMNGQETARQIRKIDSQVLLVILTSHADFARYAFELDVHRYILKMEITEKLDEAMTSAMAKIDKCKQTVQFTTDDGKLQKVAYHQIEYIEFVNHRVVIHTCTETYKLLTTTPLHEIKSILPDSDFVNCYKGVIVNIEAIASISNKHILLTSGHVLPLSRQSKIKVFEMFKRYMEG